MRARPTGRRAGATAWCGSYLGVGTCSSQMPRCCVNVVSWLHLRGNRVSSVNVPLSRSKTAFRFGVIRFEKAEQSLTLQLYRPIPGISIKMSPERASRACKPAFQQTARLGAYQRKRMHSWMRQSDSNFPPSVSCNESYPFT